MKDLQAALGRAIQRPNDVAEDDPAVAHVTGSARLSAREQVEIYREQFWLRHVKSLRDDFATLDFLLGHEGFDALCRAYLAEHPPDHFRLRDLSIAMEPFLRSSDGYKDDALLADCARLEWALLFAFDAAESAPLDPSSLASIAEDDWPRATLALHPSVTVLACEHPVKAFREEVRAGKTPDRPEREDAFYVTYRKGERLFVTPIDRAQHALLAALARGEALGPACELAAAHDAETEAKLAEWFQRWVTLGWVSAVRV